jgi:Protein of unknown function (DUF2465)
LTLSKFHNFLLKNYFRYDGNLINENAFSEAINEGFKNDQFRELIMWLSNEISDLGKLEEKVKKI